MSDSLLYSGSYFNADMNRVTTRRSRKGTWYLVLFYPHAGQMKARISSQGEREEARERKINAFEKEKSLTTDDTNKLLHLKRIKAAETVENAFNYTCRCTHHRPALTLHCGKRDAVVNTYTAASLHHLRTSDVNRAVLLELVRIWYKTHLEVDADSE